MKRVSTVLVSMMILAACGAGSDGGDSASGEEWCQIAQRIEDASDAVDTIDESDSAAVEGAYGNLKDLFAEGAERAPDAILADMNTTVEGYEQFYKAIEDAKFELEQIGDLPDLDVDGLDAATRSIEEYNERECGIVADADDELAEDADAPTPTDPPATTESSDADDDPVFAGAADSDWCQASWDLEGLGEELSNVDFTNPDAVREAYQNMTTEVTRLAPLAPPEIAASVEDTVAGFQQLNDALAAVEYDLLNADLTIIDELDAEMQAATDDIDQYNFDVCGIPLDDDDGEDGSDFDPSAGTIREQAIGELVNQGFTADEAECIFDKLDFTDPDLSSDQAAMIQIFDDCGIDLGRLAEIGGLGG